MICLDDAVFSITNQGCDGRKLGRYSYVTITGKNELNTIFIICYCPVKGTLPGSVYAQHLVYMTNNNSSLPADIVCPRQFLDHGL